MKMKNIEKKTAPHKKETYNLTQAHTSESLSHTMSFKWMNEQLLIYWFIVLQLLIFNFHLPSLQQPTWDTVSQVFGLIVGPLV